MLPTILEPFDYLALGSINPSYHQLTPTGIEHPSLSPVTLDLLVPWFHLVLVGRT